MSSSKWMTLVAVALMLAATGCSMSIIKKRLPAPHPVPGGILFSYEAPSAHIVTVAGNWEGNWWGGTAAPSARYDNSIGRMQDKDGDGVWQIVEPLPPGRYMYKFVIDNNVWELDPNNPNTAEEGGFTNSLLVVK